MANVHALAWDRIAFHAPFVLDNSCLQPHRRSHSILKLSVLPDLARTTLLPLMSR